MQSRRRVLAVAAALACSCAMSVFTPAAADPVKIKFAVFVGDTEQTFVSVLRPFAEAVNKEAAGAIEIEMFPNGALGRNPRDQAQMVLDGVADIAWIAPSYTPGRFPDNAVFELPGLFRNLDEGTRVMGRLVAAGKLRGYDQFVPLGVFTTAPYGIHVKGAMASLDDLKGKKIRTANAMESATMKALGAASVGIPVTEVPEAVSRGTIDGSTAHPATLVDFGIDRVTNTHYFADLGVAPIAVVMNRAKYDSLPPAGKAAIDKFAGKWLEARFLEQIGAYNKSLVAKLQADPARKVVIPSDQERAANLKRYEEVVNGWVAADPHNAEFLKIVNDQLAAVRGGN